MGKINREDMLELTRRMTVQRSCFSRIAGAYLDEEGYIDGTFNKHFGKLSVKEQQKNLELAKAIPFAETNVELKEYVFDGAQTKPGSFWQMLMALLECGLKNDALLEVFYEYIGGQAQMREPYAIYVFYGSYDVPLKGSDGEEQWESEAVYSFMVCALCPVSGDYEPGKPASGFLFPAFCDRSGDIHKMNVFCKS